MNSRTLLLCVLCVGCIRVSDQQHADRLALYDRDGDGHYDASVGGDDCDDDNPAAHPGAQETCAIPGDEDCDKLADEADPDVIGLEPGWVDRDEDGYGDSTQDPELVCLSRSDRVSNDLDCNDRDPDVYPGAPEACPGYGPDMDCDDTPVACELPASEAGSSLESAGYGEHLAGGHELLAAVHDGAVTVWNLAQVSDMLPRSPSQKRGGEASWGLESGAEIALDGSSAGILVSLPDLDDYGAVSWLRMKDSGDDLDEDLYDGKEEAVVGAPAGWITGFEGTSVPQIGAVHRGTGTTDLLYEDGGWKTTRGVNAGAVRLTGRPDGDRHLVALSYPNGNLHLWGGPTLASLSWVGSVIAGDVAGLGSELRFAELDGNAGLELIATSADSVRAFAGPLASNYEASDAIWVHATPGAPSALAIGDFNADGLDDFAVGLPEAADGVGAVWVFVSAPGVPAGSTSAPRLTLVGEATAGRLGAGVTFADNDGDGIDDLFVGVPGEGQILLVPGGADW